jgi:hypothetical protein
VTRKVDDPALFVRPAVVDHHLHRAVVRQVDDADTRAERQRAVGGGQGVAVVARATGGLPALELVAVVGRAAGLGRLDPGGRLWHMAAGAAEQRAGGETGEDRPRGAVHPEAGRSFGTVAASRSAA